MLKRVCAFAIGISMSIACCLPGRTQQTERSAPATEPLTLHVVSQLVVLDVVVTDKSGQLRNDLKKSDFTITEDGVAQTIRDFEPPELHRVPAKAAINSTSDLERVAPGAPVTIVVLDELNTTFQNMAYARYALKKYLNAQPSSLQAPTMLIAVSKGHFQVLKDYTQDQAAVITALDHHLTSYPWHLEAGVSAIRQLAESLGALEQVADAAVGHPGHKNVLWIGHGFPGIDLTNPMLDSNETKGITTGVQHVVNKLRDSRITLYTIDPTLVSPQGTFRVSDASPQGELNGGVGPDPFSAGVQFTALAPATGGKAFYSRNDVDAEIGESARDGVNYYTLTYRPTSATETSRPYRRIRIEVSQPGLRAGYREGYYTRDADPPIVNANRATYDLDAAVESTMIYTGLSVVAVADPKQAGHFYVGVPQSQLQWFPQDGREAAKVSLVTVSVDKKGKILKRITQDVTAHRPVAEEVPDAPSSLVRFEVDVPDVPDTGRLRFVLRELPDGRIGTANLSPSSAQDHGQSR